MPRSQFRQPARIFTEPFTDLINKQKPREDTTPRITQPRLPLNFRYSQLPGTVRGICSACGTWYQAIPKRLTRCRRCQASKARIITLPTALLPWQLIKPGNDAMSQFANVPRSFLCQRCGRAFHNWAIFGCLCGTPAHTPRWCRLCCAVINPSVYGLDADTAAAMLPPTPEDPEAWLTMYRQGNASYSDQLYARYLNETLGYRFDLSQRVAEAIAASGQPVPITSSSLNRLIDQVELDSQDYDGGEDDYDEDESEDDNF